MFKCHNTKTISKLCYIWTCTKEMKALVITCHQTLRYPGNFKEIFSGEPHEYKKLRNKMYWKFPYMMLFKDWLVLYLVWNNLHGDMLEMNE